MKKRLYLIISALFLFGLGEALIAALVSTALGTAGSVASSALTKTKEEKITPKVEPEIGEAKSPELGADAQAAEKRRRKGKSALTIKRDAGTTGASTTRSTGANI